MAKIEVTVPDGEFCSDSKWLGCTFEKHDRDMHVCGLYQPIHGPGASITPVSFTINGEKRNTFRKCFMCLASKMQDRGKGLTADEGSLV